MLQNLQRLLPTTDLFAWIGAEHRQATQLALKAEARVRELNGLTPNPTEAELVTILQSICLLLQRLEIPSQKATQETETEAKLESEETLELPTVLGEIIKLRDWVLLAKKNQPETEVEVLSAIHYELGQILQREGVISLEETDIFDCERHQIIATQPTDDPQQSDRICATVRSGYLFRDELIRPQQAIVYVFQPSEN